MFSGLVNPVISTLSNLASNTDVVSASAEAGRSFLQGQHGLIFAVIGAAIATILPGMGSAKGVGMVGEAGAGVTAEDPSRFSKLLVLQLLPATQGIYGMLTSFLLLNSLGLIGGSAETLAEAAAMTNGKGLAFLISCLPITIVGYFSALKQARVSAAGVSLVAKRADQMSKGMIFAAMVETYAILALLISVLGNFGIARLNF